MSAALFTQAPELRTPEFTQAPEFEDGQAWEELASCKQMEWEVFFPTARAKKLYPGGPKSDVYARARSTCSGCPVRPQCLARALKYEDEAKTTRHGMWGGLDPDERQALSHRRHAGSRNAIG